MVHSNIQNGKRRLQVVEAFKESLERHQLTADNVMLITNESFKESLERHQLTADNVNFLHRVS